MFMKVALHFRVTFPHVDLIHEITFPFAVSYYYKQYRLTKLFAEELKSLQLGWLKDRLN